MCLKLTAICICLSFMLTIMNKFVEVIRKNIYKKNYQETTQAEEKLHKHYIKNIYLKLFK